MEFDPVKVIIEVEKRFGIVIPNRVAERMITVGELYSYVLKEAHPKSALRCPTARAFYHLRRKLSDEFGLSPRRIRPNALLRDLFPGTARRGTWPQVGTAVGLPDLPDPDPVIAGPSKKAFVKGLMIGTIVAWLAGPLLAFLVTAPNMPPLFLTFLITLVVVWLPALILVCLFFATWRGDSQISAPLPSKVRDLVLRWLARYGDASFLDSTDVRAPRAIWNDLTDILSSNSGIAPGRIWPEHQWTHLEMASPE